MLSQAAIAAYRRDGFIVLPDILTPEEVEALRRVTDEFVHNARNVAANDEVYDLEESHSPDEPSVRRIKAPHLHHPEYARAARHPKIVEVLQDLWGTVRFDTGKLNMKSAGYGAPVEWHQDWAFYPHTNDDLAAVGIMLDDCGIENGPMMVVPGSHQGPIWDHHGPDGRFCGAIDPTRCEAEFSRAAPCLGKAGSITVHHVRAMHGSATNFSGKERRCCCSSTVPPTPGRCSVSRRGSEIRRTAARGRPDIGAASHPRSGSAAVAAG
jgi:phytanoyl-CoA hydroxylase